MDTPVSVAAIQARTSALNAELEFHKDLLSQLLTPPGKPSSKSIHGGSAVVPSQSHTRQQLQPRIVGAIPKSAQRIPASVRRGTYWGTYTPQEETPTSLHQSFSSSLPSSRDTKTHDDIESLLPPPAPTTTTTTRHHVVVSPPHVTSTTRNTNDDNSNSRRNKNMSMSMRFLKPAR